MDPYATHLEALTATLLAYPAGPILELGCGDYSTPLLAAFAKAQGRSLLVQASDEAWANRYAEIATVQIVEWFTWAPPAARQGFVFLDSEESVHNRLLRLPMLRDVADVIVMHDADVAARKPHWDECSRGFAVQWHRRYVPWTAVLRPVAQS